MKTINRRSFISKIATVIGALFAAPMAALSVGPQTARLESGDALITVDGVGLQLHLESFMCELLEAIQVRAKAENEDGGPDIFA